MTCAPEVMSCSQVVGLGVSCTYLTSVPDPLTKVGIEHLPSWSRAGTYLYGLPISRQSVGDDNV